MFKRSARCQCHHAGVSDWDTDSANEDRAPICPDCGVTALPRETANVLEPAFVCENPDCDAFGEVVAGG